MISSVNRITTALSKRKWSSLLRIKYYMVVLLLSRATYIAYPVAYAAGFVFIHLKKWQKKWGQVY